MDTPFLYIYKASAGSGKTYTLVREYLRLLLQTGDLLRFRRIVAMTFTNKAALEMKERVVENLHRLSEGGERNRGLIEDYARSFGLEEEDLVKRATKALSFLLHNYSDLNVLTIDKFNVRLIRSFIRDLNMAHDFEVVVDTAEFNERVVDLFLDSIYKGENDDKEKMVVHFVESKLEREENWALKKEIIETLYLFEKERHRMQIPALLEHDFDFLKHKQIKEQRDFYESDFEKFKIELLNPFLERYELEDLSSAFSDKVKNFHHLFNNLKKIKGQQIFDVALTESNMKVINDLNGLDQNPTVEELLKICRHLVHVVDVQYGKYRAYDLALKSFHKLALMRFLIAQIEEEQKHQNMLPLSEVNSLISEHICNEHTAYIYEKIGVRFDHFLLDEFQDTSEMQWSNLIPLVHNAISQGKMNLIVGDSKQAIYRFRNGVVEQFAILPHLYNPNRDAKKERLSIYFDENAKNEPLNDNYRSTQDVILFNNALFQELRDFLPEDFKKYYENEDLVQNPISSAAGFVCVEMRPKDNSRKYQVEESDSDDQDDDEMGDDETQLYLLKTIQDLLARGYQAGDICILSRQNEALQRWSNYLLGLGYQICTDEGMRVSNSKQVRLLVQWFRLLSKPNSLEFRRNFMLNYFQVFETEQQEAWLPYFPGKTVLFDQFKEDKFSGESIHTLRYENLYDLSQKMVKILNFDEMSDPYVHFFSNMVFSFDVKYGPSIERFLAYYDKKGKDRKLPLADDQAIRLMTTHKSKGLEFPVVIIPEANWATLPKSKSNLLFFDEQHDLFYFGSNKRERGTDLELISYQKELNEGILDVMNLFYVACTRAAKELHIGSTFDMKSDKKTKVAKSFDESYKLGSALQEVLRSKLAGKVEETGESSFKFQFGTPTEKLNSSEGTGEQMSLKLDRDTLWFPDISIIDQETLDHLEIDSERLFGRYVHLVLEHMIHPGDLEKALSEVGKKEFWDVNFETKIRKHLKQILGARDLVEIIFPNPEIGELVYNEREIIVDEKVKIRPDRVIIQGSSIRIIEYKTGQPRSQDQRQLQKYAEALRQMEFESIKPFLVYTDRMEIQQLDF